MRLFPTPLLLAALLGLSQCKHKSPDPTPPPPPDPLATLPPETQTGAGTFGCLVDGKPYTITNAISTSGEWILPTRLSVGASLYPNGDRSGDFRSITMVLNGQLLAPPTFMFAIVPATNPSMAFTTGSNQFYTFSGGPSCIYDGNFIKTGQVELVKFDGVARIAAGRFAFTLYEPGGCNTLRVTNGRFDVKF
ncbi:hypothetical protein [Hymenobacter psoromatis]|uniref:hypothetical protein n=1 Tax=Hymenobacter psoromatis TaxID=1484116 RepID=UPI001CBCDDDB|nr:hypothetical protein [Hymenobacter psoromatis]